MPRPLLVSLTLVVLVAGCVPSPKQDYTLEQLAKPCHKVFK